MMKRITTLRRVLIVIGLMALLAAGVLGVFAQESVPQEPPLQVPSPFHPTFALLDENGGNVLQTGEPVSTMQTCGACHDTAFIERYSFHADVGLGSLSAAGDVAGGWAWDTSPGYFGRWNPISYRYLSAEGDTVIDLTTAGWIQAMGTRHVGGGPAVYGRSGERLTELTDAGILETHIYDETTGELVPWDWTESGVVEMNCFLCHIANPNNDARVESLRAGEFKWANTATLTSTGLVERVGGEWQWNESAFDETGNLVPEFVFVQDPTTENCAVCHGLAHVDAQTPLTLDSCEPTEWSTITSGQIFSPQRMYNSGVNFVDKHTLSRSWDIHAERVLECADCHYSLNNPIYYQEGDASRPAHLLFDPRRIDLGEYLYRPLHQFAKGQSAQGTLAPELDNTLRRCESCHSIDATHDWLPYKDRHMVALSCEACHVPHMYAPSRLYNDWTVLTSEGAPQTECRGIEEFGLTFSTGLLSGFQPVLLPRDNGDGTVSLAPHNLVTSWFWVYGDSERPVPWRNLYAAWIEDGAYRSDVMAVFDANTDGQLDETELVIDSDAKTALIAAALEVQGLNNSRIMGVVQPYGISHNVATGEWAVKTCENCHTEDSRVNAPLTLANRLPGGVMPVFVSATVTMTGELVTTDDGTLFYRPSSAAKPVGLYILGHDSVYWIDLLGALAFLGVLLGVTVHGGLRYLAARRTPPHTPELRQEYMYSLYERQWHWLQTVVILILIFTGLVIHKPDQFGLFSFRYMVEIHNIMALILVINAGLAAFYHLASGEIRQYIPQPRGFFNQAFEQAVYYARGIFRGEPHPMQKTPERKLNPLQQVTYFAILNVLLPLQVITGIFMWGAQRWPELTGSLGGLPFLAPFHTLIAWAFATFIVLHVYLTTTAGHTPMAGIKAMVMGWDDIEAHPESTNETEHGEVKTS